MRQGLAPLVDRLADALLVDGGPESTRAGADLIAAFDATGPQ